MELRENLTQKQNFNKRQVDFNKNSEEDLTEQSQLEVDKTIDELKALTKTEKMTSTKTSKSSKASKSSKSSQPNIHKDHRKRLKEQFLESGINALRDVQKLELLLFYAIPLKDTNPLAHEIISKIGSLKDVFTADYSTLMNIKGVKENTALLLTLVGSLFNSIAKPEISEVLNTTSKAKEFCKKLYAGVEVEQFYVILLNKSNRVKKYKLIQTGTADEVNIQIRSITQFALEERNTRIIVSHNHPAGYGAVSDEDCRFTYSLICSCMLNSIEVVDHIIVGIDRAISMKSQNLLDKLKQRAFERLQLPKEKKLFTSDVSEKYVVDDD